MLIVKRWAQNGFQVVSNGRRSGRKEMLNAFQQAWLVAPETLREQQSLTLVQRALAVKRKYGLRSFSDFCLRRYYKKHKVRYVKPQFNYRAKEADKDSIREQQHNFSFSLTQYMISAEDTLIYLDETTVHCWMTPRYLWCRQGMTFAMPDQRNQSLTIIGAISSQHGLLHYSIIEGSNNQEKFAAFTEDLLSLAPQRCIVFMDNLSVHKAKSVKCLFNDTQRQAFFPPYSSTLNPIERLWAQVKLQWRKEVLKRGGQKMSMRDAKVALRIIMDGLSPTIVKRLTLSHHTALAKSLQGELV